ncbi:hypothetical protein INS49_006585 [Diaporthe citri]|uniref:uncharacterized protein n=1 Tax=Diaporthe citri TaxID=83186 RepID=UPI001C81D838|nr:uncharacterized protein INS49_006585 [Diaporthe citri]KAG6364980.1 hypothetical protein INS49_006585 [Diaporthe citri]
MSGSSSSTPGQPGSFKPLGDGVWEGFIDTNNAIKGRWSPAAQKLLAESAEELSTDAASAKQASERAAFDAARHLRSAAVVIKGSWHTWTVNSATPNEQTPDPRHLTLDVSASSVWMGRFKVHAYLPTAATGANLFKLWKPTFSVIIVNGGFSQTLSTKPGIPKGFEKKLSEPKKKEAPAPGAASSSTPKPWTPPQGATKKKGKVSKTEYWASKDGKTFWDMKGKAIPEPK